MPHSINAIILKGSFQEAAGAPFDLRPIRLTDELTLFHIDLLYLAYWEYEWALYGNMEYGFHKPESLIFPLKVVIFEMMKMITGNEAPVYAVIETDYFAGMGDQYANVFIGRQNADKNMRSINEALRFLGVEKAKGMDEFDTVGLSDIRSTPDYLEKWIDLAYELNL